MVHAAWKGVECGSRSRRKGSPGCGTLIGRRQGGLTQRHREESWARGRSPSQCPEPREVGHRVALGVEGANMIT